MSSVWVEEERAVLDTEQTSSIIQVRACTEQLQHQLYAIHEAIDKLKLDDTIRSKRVSA